MPEIQQALDAIIGKLERVERFVNYYDGNHDLAFASEKFRNTFGNMLRSMRENLCPIVVDAPADRMEVINFSAGEGGKAVAEAAWIIWQRNLLELVSNDVHKEAFKTGEAYVIVEEIDGESSFTLQDSRQCALLHDKKTGKPLFGAKLWKLDDDKLRLNLYFPDRTLRFVTRKAHKPGLGNGIKERDFLPLENDTEQPETPNPYGMIPLFYFEAEAVLHNAIPIQDRLNKTICDELVAQEFSAFRQRYATGLEPPMNDLTGKPELPFQAGVDRLWWTTGENVKFGEFGAADLGQFLSVEDAARLSIARVTGTPLHFFSFTTSDAISGEALKTLESRFTKRVKRTCLNFGVVWSKAMAFALTIENKGAGDASLTAQWEAPEQRSESEMLDNLGKKKDILEVPVDTLREEYGYTEEDLTKFNAAAAPDTNEQSSEQPDGR